MPWQTDVAEALTGATKGLQTGLDYRLKRAQYELQKEKARREAEQWTQEQAWRKQAMGLPGAYMTPQGPKVMSPDKVLNYQLLQQFMGGGGQSPIQTTQSPIIPSGIGTPSIPSPPISQEGGLRIKGAKVGPFTLEREPTEAERQADIQQELSLEAKKVKTRKTAEMNVKREALRKDLESFLAVDEAIPRSAEGGLISRLGVGSRSKWEGLRQKTVRGQAVATHNAAVKRLRVQLVRAAGDVGNINIVEQQAAQQMIPSIWDAEPVARIKREYIKQMGRAIDDNNPNLVRALINKFMKTEAYQQPSDAQQQAGQFQEGQTITRNGKTYTYRGNDQWEES